MNRTKLYANISCFVFALSFSTATKALVIVPPDYIIVYDVYGVSHCIEGVQSTCESGVNQDCRVNVPELGMANVIVYESRLDEYTCFTPLLKYVQ